MPDADTYQRNTEVWIFRGDRWHPGVVKAEGDFAVQVRYNPGGEAGTVTDTVTAAYLAPRSPQSTG